MKTEPLQKYSAWLATLWVAGFLLLAAVVEEAVTLFPALLLLTALLLGWGGVPLTFRRARGVFAGVFLFVGGGVLSLVNNSDWGFAGWRFEKYWPFLFLPVVVNLLRRLGPGQWHTLLGALGAAALVLATSAAYKLGVEGNLRLGLEGSLNPNRVSELAFAFAIVLAAALPPATGRPALFAALAVALVAMLYAGVAAGSRAAFVAFLPALALIVAASVPRRRARLAGGVALLLLVPAVAILVTNPTFLDRLESSSQEARMYWTHPERVTSFSVRADLWLASLKIAKAHPLIGTGLGDAQHDTQALIDAGESRLHKSFARFHSTYAGALATTGLVGLATLLAGLFVIPGLHFWRVLRERPPDPLVRHGATAGLALLLYYLPLGLLASWLFNRGMLTFYVLFAVLLALSLGRHETSRGRP